MARLTLCSAWSRRTATPTRQLPARDPPGAATRRCAAARGPSLLQANPGRDIRQGRRRATPRAVGRRGFRTLEEEDITANVVRALETDTPVRRDRIEQRAPKLLRRHVLGFAAVEGSPVYKAFAERELTYLRFVLEKRSPADPIRGAPRRSRRRHPGQGPSSPRGIRRLRQAPPAHATIGGKTGLGEDRRRDVVDDQIIALLGDHSGAEG